jgi:hypothetical protein
VKKMLCPLLGRCKAKVSVDHYRNVCSNLTEDAFKKCEHWLKTVGTEKTPAEWSQIFAPTTPPT